MSYPMYHRDFAKEFVPKLQIVAIKAIEMHFNETKNISIEIGKLKSIILVLLNLFKRVYSHDKMKQEKLQLEFFLITILLKDSRSKDEKALGMNILIELLENINNKGLNQTEAHAIK